MVYVATILIILMAIFGIIAVINDVRKKNNNFNRHAISFKDGYVLSGVPFIQLKINGRLEWFLADSGSSINFIRQSYFDSLDKKPSVVENKNDIHTGSGVIKSLYCTMSLSHEKTKFDNEIFNIAQLNALEANSGIYKRDVIGIIGSPFFEKYGWTICYNEMSIYINK